MMERNCNRVLKFSINGKESVVYIGKDVIRKLSNPSYVTVMVNYKSGLLAVMPCKASDTLSFHVPEKLIEEDKIRFRIYSKSFVKRLLDDLNLEENRTYSFKGVFNEKGPAVVFNLNELRNKRFS